MFLNSLKVLEKYWIPLSSLEKSSKFNTLSTPHCFLWNRGYYMAAWRYEIPLRLSEIFVDWVKYFWFNGKIKQIFRAQLPVSNIWNNHLPWIIAFPWIITPSYYSRKYGNSIHFYCSVSKQITIIYNYRMGWFLVELLKFAAAQHKWPIV